MITTTQTDKVLPRLIRGGINPCGDCDGWRKGMICQGQDIGNRHKIKLSRNYLDGIILKVEVSSLLYSIA
jgi:hypothetical protein